MGTFQQRSVMLPLLQPPAVNISFSDIKLNITSGLFRKENKMVLRGVSGTFRSGELTAIMGPSGAGKSSLLNILTGFHVSGMSGEVKMDGNLIRPGKDGTRKQSCYIMQEDHLNPMFSVMEIMTMAAHLKLGNGLPKKAKILVVEDILDSLGMAGTKYTKCGRLSGGQKKRLCIALELIDNPPIMYLDEPTTGLDSSSTVQLVTMLKSLARGNRNIVCTIHQPCASIFELFDHAYFISKGLCVYQGSSRNVVPFLQTIGLQCPIYHNPADYMLDVVCGEFGEYTEPMILAAKDPTWRIPPTQLVPLELKEANSVKTCILITSPSEFTRFAVLFKRNLVQLHRDWTISYLKIFLHMLVGIVMGLLFRHAGSDGNKSITNISYFMCAIVYQSFTSVMPAVLKFPAEINTLKKEQFNNWYKLRTYYMAFLMANLPLQMLYSAIFISISYYLSDQIMEIDRFFKFGSVCMLTVLTSECLGLALGTVDNPVVEDILDSLGMAGTKYTKCGRLSGGQKKRLCIALELIDNPPIMYLDEPTTGLDSSSTVQLVTMLKSLARGNRNIVCTIHQPCASIFELFDHAYFISKGLCVYQGSSRNVVPFLQTIGLQCPIYHNPADYMLDVVCGEFGEYTEPMILAAKDPTWRIPPTQLVPLELKEANSVKTCILITSPSEFTRFAVLFKRNLVQLHRDWTISYLKIFLHMLVGIVMGLLFRHAGSDGNKSITNISYFMCAIVYQSFTSVMPAVLKFPAEINTLKKEQFNNWYKLRTYYMAFLMANLPLQMLYSAIFISISYYLSDQIMEIDRFFKFGSVCMLTVLTSECLGLALGTVDNPVVEDILDSLGMAGTKYTKCGRLSGGQKKRLCIALELIDNPPIMYLDEPTTGLDSSSTVQLVTMLKSLARGNRNIVCTIHQPCASIFELFDHAYFISKGLCVYQGSSRNVVPFLQTIGLQCPIYHNPADYMLDVVCGEFGEYTEPMILAAKDPTWRIPPTQLVPLELKEANSVKTCILITSPSEFTRFAVLFKRNLVQLHRDWTISYLKIFLHMLVGIVMGLLFRHAGSDGNKSITNISYFMCAIVYQSFTSVMPAVLKFPAEINTLKKEQFNNWYKLRTYYMAFLMANLPLQMLYSAIFISISYYLSDQIMEIDRFFKFGSVCMLTVLTSECLGLALGTVDNPVNGIFWGSVMLAVQILLAGFLAILTHMPRFLYYISYANYMRYGLQAMVISIYGYNRQTLKCPVDELYCHLRYPEKILTEIGMEQVNFWVNTAFLGTFFSISCINAYFFLHRKVKSQ